MICAPLRTPVGRFGGVFRDVPAATLGATVITALIERTGIDPASIDDVLFGQCYPNGEAPAIGRVAALDAGLPIDVPGYQIDRRCGSGLTAVVTAAMQVQTGAAEVVLAGGAESMSQAEFYGLMLRWGPNREGIALHDRLARARVTAGGERHPVPGGMLETAENVRARYAIPRAEQDAFALESHRRAVAAQRAGRFLDEIVPVTVRAREGDRRIESDEHPRPDANLERLASMRPILSGTVEDATVTAGNASGQNDGASVCLVTTPERAHALGLRPLARLTSWAVAGVAPALMGLGPVPSTAKALARAGLTLADIDLIELNEAFAAQALGVTREWGLRDADFERLNVNGSGISLGHPVGATGGRILATLLHELDRREARYGLETMCIGGGQGITAIFERIAP
ncbi:Acetyl-CoA acetyltransferase [Patulibacter medicamentivorans]|uniref:Probable acetyl-CoA acetyltransferase n=1 Tax=Patulibacter medicamentivorans TaxID=1097667 RepID=H0E806_9ACTN|nr:Acetyl-CoA acetyltransferase [Patulibacter medicamentivorans]